MIRQLGRTFAALAIFHFIVASMPWIASCSAATIIGNPVLLSTLLPPGSSIVSGDKTFDNFTYLATGDMPPATSVNVVAIQDSSGNFGIRFQGNFLDVSGLPGGSDALINYRVTAAAGHLISDAHIEGNPTRLGALGSVSVVDTFLPHILVPPYRMVIYDDQNLGTKLVDSTAFTPEQSLTVQKDIAAYAVVNPQSPASTVTISFVDQTYSQIIIPEPATSMLVLGSAVGLALVRRRSSVR